MKLKKYIFSLIALAGLCLTFPSCTDDTNFNNSPNLSSGFHYNDDGSLNVDISFEVPSPSSVSTREMGYSPAYDDLTLYVLVFEEKGGRLLYTKVANSSKDLVDDETHSGRKLVKFNTNLNPTDNEVVIHLLATNQPDIANQLGEIGNENLLRTIYTNFTVENEKRIGHEAYWARIDIDNNILNAEDRESEARATEILGKLSHVPMVRNFCRLSAEVVSEQIDLVIDKLYLINATDRGSVVPYLITDAQSSETQERKGFVKFFDDNNKPKDLQTLDPAYIGEPPTGTIVMESNDLVSSQDIDGKQSIYFYERPYRSENRTYAIIKGHRKGNPETPMYYKVDLGKKDETSAYGEFKYFNLIRNFDYRIKITGADVDGYPTLEEAKNGNVFNNLSTSVETQNLLSISEGNDAIIVNRTNYIYTASRASQEVEIWGQYMVRTSGNTTYESNELKALIEDEENGTGFLEFVNEEGVPDRASNTKSWKIKLKSGVTASHEPRQQTVVIYRGKKENDFGLYRKITFTLIDHFIIEKIATYPGLWDTFEEAPWSWPVEDDESYVQEVGQGVDSPLTLFFQLEKGLPESIFPLEFTIESDKQNIQNAYVGNAVVNTVGPSGSLFWGEQGHSVQSARIQYIKSVTWEDYINSNIVRVRFLTTTDLSQDGIGSTEDDGRSWSITTLSVYNEYFDKILDKFLRDTESSDPTPVYADFCHELWDNMISILENPNHERLTAENNKTDNLSLVESSKGSMNTGTDQEGHRYIGVSNTTDRFQYTVTYKANKKRTLRVEVMATDDQDQAVESSITCANNQGPTSLSFRIVGTKDEGAYTTYIYETTVPSIDVAVTRTISIKPTVDKQRFYWINIYPRYDEMTNDLSSEGQ